MINGWPASSLGAHGAATWKETLLAPLARVKEGVAGRECPEQQSQSKSQMS